MVVKKLESPLYYRRRRESLPGKGVEEEPKNREKTFDQYLLDAFGGEVVQEGNKISPRVSNITRDNLIRLSQI